MKQHLIVSTFEKIYITILLVIFGGIVLQGPIIVGFGTLWPNYDLLIKSWKEILMLIAGFIALFLLYKNKQFKLLRNPILIIIGIYALLHLIVISIIHTGFYSSLAGLVIDLRYVFFFALVYVALKLYPNYRKTFIKVGIVGAIIVLVFAFLQVFILPADVLKYIGYNINTISPYLTVDQNNHFVRINSTLRGPNPLGAYAGMILVLVLAAIISYKTKIKNNKWLLLLISMLSVSGVVALWASYSRSALIGTALAIVLVLSLTIIPKISLKSKIISIVVAIIIAVIGSLWIVNNSNLASNILLHENPNGGSVVNSNEGHINSLITGANQLIRQPFGSGVGSTGSASLFGINPIIIENQYIFIAHEVGWLGLLCFIIIFGLIIAKLWSLRQNWLALGVLASGISLAFIGLLLPVWVDDTVSIVWWGLAAIALASKNKEYN